MRSTLTLALHLLLLLEHLLLSRIQVLQGELRVSAVLHGGHHGRGHAAGRATADAAASKLLRHAAARRAGLATIRVHTGTHWMASRMAHASRMTLEVGAHTRGHHSSTSRSAILESGYRRMCELLLQAHASMEGIWDDDYMGKPVHDIDERAVNGCRAKLGVDAKERRCVGSATSRVPRLAGDLRLGATKSVQGRGRDRCNDRSF